MNTARTWLIVGALLASSPAAAHEGDTFRPYVSAGYYRDSNLFRFADGESPGTQREDTYAVYQAGIKVDWKPGRQQFVLDTSQTRIRYDNNPALDFDGDDTELFWNWRLGNRFSGTLGATQSTSQSSFDDLGFVNNSVERERRLARAEWELHPRWRIGGGVETAENINSALVNQNFSQDAYDLTLTYRTPKGSQLRAQIKQTESDYPLMQVISNFGFFSTVADSSYKQTEYLLGGDWRVSAKLTLRGQAGWLDRQYLNALRSTQAFNPVLVERQDFDGFTGRLTTDWFPTAKTLLSLVVYQEANDAGDINASTVFRRGSRLNGVWLAREKWRLNAGFGAENRDFRGDVAGQRRQDDTLSGSLSVSYAPIRMLSLDMGLQVGHRDSTLPNDDYDFRTLFANVRADF